MRGSLALLLALCVLLALDAQAEPGPLAFSTPLKLNTLGPGYEPGIDVDSRGTLYVTAHKSGAIEDTRLSSWLWYSHDGATWAEMPSPHQAHDKLFAFEGDLAVDARDNLYYVDTYLADNTLTRWTQGPAWDYTMPVQGSTLLDDRPWISAQGDGIVYSIGNNGLGSAPSPEELRDGAFHPTRSTFYRSTDGGLSWSIGRGLPDSGWCNVEASLLDDVTVYTVCISDSPPHTVWVQESHDRGETFKPSRVAELAGNNTGFPSITVDGLGNVYVVWVDWKIDWTGAQMCKLMVARWTPAEGAWTTFEVPTAPGTIMRPWIDSGSGGVVAIAYYGTPDLYPTGSTLWRTYVALSADADRTPPTWETVEVSGVVQRSQDAPGDFMQLTVGPDDRVHLVYGKRVAPSPLHAMDYTQDIYYVGQVSGPNLS